MYSSVHPTATRWQRVEEEEEEEEEEEGTGRNWRKHKEEEIVETVETEETYGGGRPAGFPESLSLRIRRNAPGGGVLRPSYRGAAATSKEEDFRYMDQIHHLHIQILATACVYNGCYLVASSQQ